MIYFIIFVVIAIIVFRLYLRSPIHKGHVGEKNVSNALKKYCGNNGYVVDNLILTDSNTGMTSQIDHVLVCEKGIFSVETKNYNGRIYGKDNQLNWMQVLAYGKSKNKFYNPVKQNQTHIYELSKVLEDRKIFNLVIFINANIDNVESSNTIRLKDLNKYLSALPNILDIQEINDIKYTLLEIKESTNIKTSEHVKNIHKQQEQIENNICPRCGEKLVLREGTFGQFYGCVNYPKCKFKKKI